MNNRRSGIWTLLSYFLASRAVGLGLAGHEGRSAVIIGAGTIGLVTLQAARLSGIEQVAVVEPQGRRRERAQALGAHAVYEDDAAAREGSDDLGVDLVIDAVGAAAARAAAIELVRPGGRVVCIGLADDATPLSFHAIVRNQITISGSYAYTRSDFETAVKWLVGTRLFRVAGIHAAAGGGAGRVRAPGHRTAGSVQGLSRRRRTLGMSEPLLAGRVVAVVGASSGIGAAIARAFADAGAQVHAPLAGARSSASASPATSSTPPIRPPSTLWRPISPGGERSMH